jgi:hypothetical protein
MANNKKTLYEVLGVARDAKVTDIGRAYNRIKTELQKESSAPDPRLAAMAKVAYETLSDPDRREEYDKSLGVVKRAASGKGMAGGLVAAVVAAVVAAGGGGYYFFARVPPKAAQHAAEKALTPAELVEAMTNQVGRLQGALMSGEVRELGMAVAVGDNEMATTCSAMAAGMLLTVSMAGASWKAEIARANQELDICLLSVKGVTGAPKTRAGIPNPQEKIQAMIVNAAGKPEARQVSVARSIDSPQGKVFELKAGAALPNGTPVFDSQARVVGIVASAQAFAPGALVALGAGRIMQARGGAAEGAQQVGAAPAATPATAPTAASSADSAPGSPVPPPRRGPRGSILDQGFTTLWKEDSSGAMIEVMDNVKVGNVGDPIAFWTRWTGRDVAAQPQTHCLVTFGPDEEVVADFDQTSRTSSPDGYWSCGLTRFQLDLMDLDVGDYTFTIFVDGQPVAEASARVERKFWTRDKYAIIVVALGLGLLFLVRRKKELGKYF